MKADNKVVDLSLYRKQREALDPFGDAVLPPFDWDCKEARFIEDLLNKSFESREKEVGSVEEPLRLFSFSPRKREL